MTASGSGSSGFSWSEVEVCWVKGEAPIFNGEQVVPLKVPVCIDKY